MSKGSILARFSKGECLDPGGDVQLLAELNCQSEAVCRSLQNELEPLPCQIEWHASSDHLIVYVLGDKNADQDQLLAAIADFIDGQPGQIHFVENRLVQDCSVFSARHGFRFVNSDPAGDKEILLAAGSHAFGSGSHPSTSLVVEFLEELAEIPSPVLDVGCGTGILSLVAARLGAGQVVGIDIDQKAVDVAATNACSNHLEEKVSFSSASLQELQGAFPLILANLTGSVLFRLLEDISAKAGPGSRLIISGLQGRQGDEAEKLASNYGWKVESRKSMGKWQALLFDKTVAL